VRTLLNGLRHGFLVELWFYGYLYEGNFYAAAINHYNSVR